MSQRSQHFILVFTVWQLIGLILQGRNRQVKQSPTTKKYTIHTINETMHKVIQLKFFEHLFYVRYWSAKEFVI